MRASSLVLAVFLTATDPAAALASTAWTWRDLTPAGGPVPDARRNGAAIYDPVMRRVIVFGGIGASGHLNDTWAFDVVRLTWTRLETSGSPPAPRLGHNAVYDPVGHQMLVWAGQQGATFYDDTRALDLTTLVWTDLTPSSRPRARYGSASVFDPKGRRLVQFAGFTEEGTRFQDTQAFSPASRAWQDLTPQAARPGIRCLHTAALDRAARRMIVYGGQRSGPLDDLWAFDLSAGTWTELTPADRPPGRFWTSSFVDRDRNFVVFGGSTSAGNSNETWSYSLGNGRWTRLDTALAPSPRNGMMEAYVEAEDRLIVFGGSGGSSLLNDVWELARPAEPAANQSHFAQMANGQGWSSVFVLANPSATETASGSISLFDDSGAPLVWSLNGQSAASAVAFAIPPLGSVRYASDGLGALVSGWARVSCNIPVAGVIQFTSSELGTAGVGATAPLGSFIAPVGRSASRRTSTGLAIAALGAPVTLTATLRSASGTAVAAGQARRALAGNGHMALFLEQLFPDADTREFEGTVTVTAAGGDVVATVIQLGSRAGEFTTLPVSALR